MKSLFPKMEQELASDRLAARREEVQRAREYLRANSGFEIFILDHLAKQGPSVDVTMALTMSALCELKATRNFGQCLNVLPVAMALWRIGKLWRKEFPNHPCGEQCFIYGLRGQHPKS